jgi:hypothetical protein
MTDGPGLRRDSLTVRLWTQGGAFVSVFLGVLSFKAGKPLHTAIYAGMFFGILATVLWAERRWYGE